MRKNNLQKQLLAAGFLVVFLLILFLFPQKSVINRYMMKVVNEGLIYAIAVLGLSVILGMGGQVTFSTAGFMGIGAYISAILTTSYGWDTLPALVVAVVLGGAFSWLVGLALFRLKGSYFSFASIGFVNLVFTVLQNWMEVTGGPDGIRKIPKLDLYLFFSADHYAFFQIVFVIAVLCGLVTQRIRKTYLGRALASVRDNEITAQCMGINSYRTKVISFIIASVFACLAGGLYAFQAGYISPEPFKFDHSAIYLIMAMLGGVDSTIGAFIGSMLLTILPEKVRFLADYYQLIYGVGVIILMVVMPMGIVGLYQNIKGSLRTLRKKSGIEGGMQRV